MQGFGFRILLLVRNFFVIVIVLSPDWLGELSQAIGIGSMFTLTLLIESLMHPRMTKFMNFLGSIEEMVRPLSALVGLHMVNVRGCSKLSNRYWQVCCRWDFWPQVCAHNRLHSAELQA